MRLRDVPPDGEYRGAEGKLLGIGIGGASSLLEAVFLEKRLDDLEHRVRTLAELRAK